MKREFSAGGVLVRRLRGRWMMAAIRPAGKKEGVWALPKGLIDPGESPEETALREVWEETGHTGSIELDLGTIEYMTEKRGIVAPKVVRYFVMRDEGGEFEPGAEVDELRWLERAEARELLTYDRDREVLDRW